MKRRSLMLQLSTAVVIITTTVLALSGYYRISNRSIALEKELYDSAARTVVRLAFSLSLPYFNFQDHGIRNIVLSEMENREILAVYLYDKDPGTLLYGFERFADEIKAVSEVRQFDHTLEKRHAIRFKDKHLGEVRIVMTHQYLDRRLDELMLSDMFQTVILDGVLVILMIILLRARVVKPISDLTYSSSEIASGRLDQPIEYTGNDEISVLAVGFERMRDAIKKQIVDLKRENEERRRAETALKQSEEKYRVLVDNVIEAICVTRSRRFEYTNPEMSRLLGYSEAEFRSLTLDDIIHPDDQDIRYPISESPLKRNMFDGVEAIRVLTKTGETRLMSVKSVIISWNDDHAALSVGSDVTEQKRTEELMIQTEKMMSVGGLAAGMAHEINNPLGAMLQGTQNVERRLMPGLKYNERAAVKAGIDLNKLQDYIKERKVLSNLEGIREAGLRAAGIITNMLQFARKSESIMAPIDLARLVDNTIELANNDYDLKKKFDFRKITIDRQFDEALPLVPCMETEIEQVVLNLIRNAAQALTGDKPRKNPRITIRLVLEHETVRLEVEDNGPGIIETNRKRIFEPFFTTKQVGAGTGLGLSVSYMIITNNHKGSMEVVSEPGNGATFIIRLLLKQPGFN